MEYAIIMGFEKCIEDKFNTIIKSIFDNDISSYMTDNEIPPHITLALFNTDRIEKIITEIDKRISSFNTSGVAWASLGAFVPHTLFAAPVMNEYLQNANVDINSWIEPFSNPGDNGHYLPFQWVPHTSLAVKLNNNELKKAFEIATENFSFIYGKSNRLMLAECNPYRLLKTWELSG
ncbi:MAG: hypothetical protein FWH20_09605 [Oscillospiraceae bacterium]|nr:hypothetical protein [Oscillospiraceae bacterium]